MSQKIEYDSPVAKITWDERGIFIIKLKDTNAPYDYQEALSQYSFLLQKSGGKSFKLIFDTRQSLNFPTDSALNLYKEKNSSENKTAVIANSLPMQLMLGQMIKKIRSGNSMTFKTKEAAIKWILGS